MKRAALLFLAACGITPMDIDMTDETVRVEAEKWNAACGARIFQDRPGKGSGEVWYKHDPTACANDRGGETVPRGASWVFLCGENIPAVVGHELGHLAGIVGHHHGHGIMSAVSYSREVTNDDLQALWRDYGLRCPRLEIIR